MHPVSWARLCCWSLPLVARYGPSPARQKQSRHEVDFVLAQTRAPAPLLSLSRTLPILFTCFRLVLAAHLRPTGAVLAGSQLLSFELTTVLLKTTSSGLALWSLAAPSGSLLLTGATPSSSGTSTYSTSLSATCAPSSPNLRLIAFGPSVTPSRHFLIVGGDRNFAAAASFPMQLQHLELRARHSPLDPQRCLLLACLHRCSELHQPDPARYNAGDCSCTSTGSSWQLRSGKHWPGSAAPWFCGPRR